MTAWRRWPEQAQNLADPAWDWLARALGMPALLATPPQPLTEIALPEPQLDAAPFIALLGNARVRQDAEARLRHGGDVLKLRGGDHSEAPDLVLLPRDESEVLAILGLCVRQKVNASIFGGGNAAPRPAPICIDMTGMTRLMSVDIASGLAEAEAGITGDELARQLEARGLRPEEEFGFGTLGGRLALAPADWLADLRLATPRGLIELGFTQACGARGTLGAITAATIRVRALPMHAHTCSFVFGDFAAALMALNEAHGVAYGAHLSDETESDFLFHLRAMDRPILLRWLERPVKGATLCLTFPNLSSRLQFELTARRLKGRRLRVQPALHYRHLLLDRGMMVQRWQLSARWSQLAALRTTLGLALDQAMQQHAPREGAHGLVLAQVRNSRSDGADLMLTAIWPRLLNGDVEQAGAIRRAGDTAIADYLGPKGRPATDIPRVMKLVLDPNGVLPA